MSEVFNIILWVVGVLLIVFIILVALGLFGHVADFIDKKIFNGYFSKNDY